MGKSKQTKEKKFDRKVEISAPILDPEIIKAIHTPPNGHRVDVRYGGFKQLLSDMNSQDSTDELSPLDDNHIPSYINISCAVSGYTSYSRRNNLSTEGRNEETIVTTDDYKNRLRSTSPPVIKHDVQINHIVLDKSTIHSIDQERKELTEKLTASATERRRSPSPCVPPTEDDRHHGAYVGARYCPLPPPSKLVINYIPLLGIDDDKNPDEIVVNDDKKVGNKIASLYGKEFAEDWRESVAHKVKKEHEELNQNSSQQTIKTPKDLVSLRPTTPNDNEDHNNEDKISVESVEIKKAQGIKVLTNIGKKFLNKLLSDDNPPSPTSPVNATINDGTKDGSLTKAGSSNRLDSKATKSGTLKEKSRTPSPASYSRDQEIKNVQDAVTRNEIVTKSESITKNDHMTAVEQAEAMSRNDTISKITTEAITRDETVIEQHVSTKNENVTKPDAVTLEDIPTVDDKSKAMTTDDIITRLETTVNDAVTRDELVTKPEAVTMEDYMTVDDQIGSGTHDTITRLDSIAAEAQDEAILSQTTISKDSVDGKPVGEFVPSETTTREDVIAQPEPVTFDEILTFDEQPMVTTRNDLATAAVIGDNTVTIERVTREVTRHDSATRSSRESSSDSEKIITRREERTISPETGLVTHHQMTTVESVGSDGPIIREEIITNAAVTTNESVPTSDEIVTRECIITFDNQPEEIKDTAITQSENDTATKEEIFTTDMPIQIETRDDILTMPSLDPEIVTRHEVQTTSPECGAITRHDIITDERIESGTTSPVTNLSEDQLISNDPAYVSEQDHIEYEIRAQSPIDNQSSPVRVSAPNDSTNETETEIHDGHYYLKLLNNETTFITEQINKAEAIFREQEASLNEEVSGYIRSAIGKGNLLVTKKCNQFKELCEANINKTEGDQFATLDDDLAGFWDMIVIQIIDVKKLFETLWQAQENGWNFADLQQSHSLTSNESTRSSSAPKSNNARIVSTSSSSSSSSNSSSTSKLSAHKDQERRERLQEHINQFKLTQATSAPSVETGKEEDVETIVTTDEDAVINETTDAI